MRWLVGAILGLQIAPAAAACPEPLARATRLIVVSTAAMNATTATITTYERSRPDQTWRPGGRKMRAVVGARGLAWGWTAAQFAKPGEPLKREGDKRAPAGVFTVGHSFGNTAASLPGYMNLRLGNAFCVDDPRSKLYGRIVPRAQVPAGTSGEDMPREQLYRQGLVVDYPPNAARRAGSCIFIHVWRRPASGTAGCVATAEADVIRLQRLTAGQPAAIAILPDTARSRLDGCLP